MWNSTYHQQAGNHHAGHVDLREVVHDVRQIQRWHGVYVIGRRGGWRVLRCQHRLITSSSSSLGFQYQHQPSIPRTLVSVQIRHVVRGSYPRLTLPSTWLEPYHSTICQISTKYGDIKTINWYILLVYFIYWWFYFILFLLLPSYIIGFTVYMCMCVCHT